MSSLLWKCMADACCIYVYPAICCAQLFPSKERSKEHFLFGAHKNLTALEREQRGITIPCCPSKASEQHLSKCCVKYHAFKFCTLDHWHQCGLHTMYTLGVHPYGREIWASTEICRQFGQSSVQLRLCCSTFKTKMGTIVLCHILVNVCNNLRIYKAIHSFCD